MCTKALASHRPHVCLGIPNRVVGMTNKTNSYREKLTQAFQDNWEAYWE